MDFLPPMYFLAAVFIDRATSLSTPEKAKIRIASLDSIIAMAKANTNIRGMTKAMNEYHSYNRAVEEVKYLKEEAQRFVQNIDDELKTLLDAMQTMNEREKNVFFEKKLALAVMQKKALDTLSTLGAFLDAPAWKYVLIEPSLTQENSQTDQSKQEGFGLEDINAIIPILEHEEYGEFAFF